PPARPSLAPGLGRWLGGLPQAQAHGLFWGYSGATLGLRCAHRRSVAMIEKLANEGRGVSGVGARERPIGPLAPDARFGSDVAADTLRALDIPYIALNPGASFRGLHDSLVNRLGNERPTMLLCLHEEHAVAIAHGWAKVTGRAMAAAVHSNVGLM